MRKQKVSEPTDRWTMLETPRGEILKHSCDRCHAVTLVPKGVEAKVFHCGKWVQAPTPSWWNPLEREQAPRYTMPIIPLTHFDRTARE